MTKIYIPFVKKHSLISKFFLAAILFSIASAHHVLAQEVPANFTAINWGTAATQPYAVNEAQGRVVNGKLYTFGGFDSRKPGLLPTKRAYIYDAQTNLCLLLPIFRFFPTEATLEA